MTLTDHDKQVIARARELAAIDGPAAKERAGVDELAAAYAVLFGEARWLLTELAMLAEHQAGQQ